MFSIIKVRSAARSILTESVQVYIELAKIMIPALIVVRLLQVSGAIEGLGALMSPVMLLIGLPAVLGVAWATTLFTNLFTGIVVFVEVTQGITLSTEQVTVFGVLMVIGHSLPVEGAVARRAGVPWWFTIASRVLGAVFLAGIVHWTFSTLQIFQEPAQTLWQANSTSLNTVEWVFLQTKSMALIFIVILLLVFILKLLRHWGIEQLIHTGLAPMLRLLGIGQSAANITVIGVTLGLSYGAGLLIRDIDKGAMNHRDSYLALCFLGLFHSIIEDTILILSIGAHLWGILVARFLFAAFLTMILARFTTQQIIRAV